MTPGGQVAGVDPSPPAIAYATRWHRGPHGLRHAQAIDLAPLAEAAGFRVEAHGDLPMLHYVRAVR